MRAQLYKTDIAAGALQYLKYLVSLIPVCGEVHDGPKKGSNLEIVIRCPDADILDASIPSTHGENGL